MATLLKLTKGKKKWRRHSAAYIIMVVVVDMYIYVHNNVLYQQKRGRASQQAGYGY